MAWGKIISSTVGGIFGGPLGFVAGLTVGELFDKITEEENQKAQIEQEKSRFQTIAWWGEDEEIFIQNLSVGNSQITHYVIYASENENDLNNHLKAPSQLLSDDDGDFMCLKTVFDKSLHVKIPIESIYSDLGKIRNLYLKIFGLHGKNAITQEVVKVDLDALPFASYVRSNFPRFFDELKCFDILKWYALRNGTWNAEKVRLLKEAAASIYSKSVSESEQFRNFLKKSESRDLHAICNLHKEALIFTDDRVINKLLDYVTRVLRLGNLSNKDIERELIILSGHIGFESTYLEHAISEVHGKASHNSYDKHSHDHAKQQSDHKQSNGSHQKSSSAMYSAAWAREILEVHAGATKDDINKAYRKKMSELHPDKYADKPKIIQDFVNEQAKNLNKARDILLSS